MERRILLETLADQLPTDSIRFNSKLARIERSGTGETLLELEDGTRLNSKVKPLQAVTVALQSRLH